MKGQRNVESSLISAYDPIAACPCAYPALSLPIAANHTPMMIVAVGPRSSCGGTATAAENTGQEIKEEKVITVDKVTRRDLHGGHPRTRDGEGVRSDARD